MDTKENYKIKIKYIISLITFLLYKSIDFQSPVAAGIPANFPTLVYVSCKNCTF